MENTILIVEDDIDVSEDLKTLLQSEGYRVALARNGRIALEALRAHGGPPALILLDLMMPIMDGFQFRQRQLQLEAPGLASVPVLIMTAGGSAEAKAESLGAKGFIRKPIELEAALSEIARHVPLAVRR